MLLEEGVCYASAFSGQNSISLCPIAVKRREVKSKGEKQGYKHLNAEFQRRTRKDKKAFFSNQRKEIEEKNRMGKTRDLFKKIRDTKGIFHAKMGSIKDRNCMDLFIIGDWNAKVECQETPGVTGKFGLGMWNEQGKD